MANAQQRVLQQYLDLIRLNGSSHAVRAAMQLGIFDALGEGQKTVDELARACGLQREPLALLLDVLRSLKVVEQYGDDFAIAQVMHLLTEYDRDLGDHHWVHLAEFVRTGESLADAAAKQSSDGNGEADSPHPDEAYRASAMATQWTLTPAAMQLATILEIGTRRKGLRILDLGAGSAVWSLAIAHHDVDAEVTAVDWPEPLEIASETAESIGLDERFQTIHGDWRKVDLPVDEYDLIIAANVFQLESPDGVQQQIARLFPALRMGGELAIVDVFPGQEKGDLYRNLFALRLALRTRQGQMHSPDMLQLWLMQAGFERPTYAHLPTEPHILGLMVAAKPR
ncbi:MAG: methyltransferase domain-containing protein [Planctomycetales bacterium]|nr:methyltransferase domain-containing protein [Planctomycetales bacterium]